CIWFSRTPLGQLHDSCAQKRDAPTLGHRASRGLGLACQILMGRIMVPGLSLAAFTTLHVLISLAAIASGIVVVAGMLRADRLGGWTALFLALTMLTSLTGFLFPIK